MSQEPKTCLTQLPKCQARCCKVITFDVKNPTQDILYYYRLHGCETIRRDRSIYRIVVPLRCNALTDDLRCSLHGTPEKPQVCNRLNEKTADQYHITPNCIFSDKKEAKLYMPT